MYICDLITNFIAMYTFLTLNDFQISKKWTKGLFYGFLFSIASLCTVKGQVATRKRTISVDFNKSSGPLNTMFKECIGAGRANEGLRADWQQQLAYVKKECGFKYIRMHGLLTDDMAIYKEDNKGNAEYNYQYVDALYDYLLSINVKPFVLKR